MNWYHKYIRHKLFNKMLLIYSAITIMSISLLVTIFLSGYINDSIQNQVDIHSEVIFNIEKHLYDQNRISDSVANGINTQSKVTDEITVLVNSSYEEYLNYKLDSFNVSNYNSLDLKYLLDTMLSNRSDVLAIRVNNKDNEFVSEIVLNYDKWYDKKNYQPDKYMRSVRKTIKNINLANTIGSIDIYFDLSDLNNIIKNSNLKGNLSILDEHNEAIYDSSGIFSIGEKYEVKKTNGIIRKKINDKKSIIDIKEDAQTKFKYISIIPYNELEIYSTISEISILAIVCIAMAILVTYMIIDNYSEKLKLIMNGIEDIQNGNLDVRFDIDEEQNELDMIAIGINQICSNLKYYINKTYVAEVKQKEAEISALQSQIKPHFLYNTLEVIRMCALANRNKEVSQMIYNLASMFRYSTYNNGSSVRLKDEIKYCSMYLDLCCTRYKNMLTYDVDIDDKLQEYIVPKFIMQPIVENSISHGMRKDSNDNCINISCEELNNNLLIWIEDNGIGIEENKLIEIERQLDKNLQKENSIGLMNINSRLKLKYGNEYGIKMSSKKGEKTIIMIKLPIIKDGETDV